MRGLSGKVAGVTGAARGIGQGICKRLAEEGCLVAAMDTLSTDETVEICSTTGAKAHGYKLDVTNRDQIVQTVQQIVEEWGRLDIWVNNAGVFNKAAVVDLPEEDWDRISDINFKALFLCAQAVIPHMEKNHWGRFINISSISGKMAYPNEIAYTSTKAAVLGLTRALAIELASKGITANAICPGQIRTDMMHNNYINLAKEFGMSLEQWYEKSLKTIPVGRFGLPEDIGALAAFLASEDAGFITGQAITIDGGIVLY